MLALLALVYIRLDFMLALRANPKSQYRCGRADDRLFLDVCCTCYHLQLILALLTLIYTRFIFV